MTSSCGQVVKASYTRLVFPAGKLPGELLAGKTERAYASSLFSHRDSQRFFSARSTTFLWKTLRGSADGAYTRPGFPAKAPWQFSCWVLGFPLGFLGWPF